MGLATLFICVLASSAVLQGINAYSQKAEEAIKNLTEYELLIPKNASKEGGAGGLAVALNAVAGVADFWSDKLIEAANQADQVSRFTLPEFRARVANLANIIARIDSQNDLKVKDGVNIFEVAAQPIKVGIEIVALLKQMPIENFTYDKVKELVSKAVSVIVTVKPQLTVNVSRIQSEVKAQLARVEVDLQEFTPETIRKKCYPNVVCVANLLQNLKTSVTKTANVIAKGEGDVVNTSMQVEIVTDAKIREEEEKIKKLAREWADLFLQSHSITKETISEYYVSVIVQYNPSAKQVEEIVNSAITFINELSFVNEVGKNQSKNIILSGGYPVIDAWNTVYYLVRNKDGKVLGNEINEVNALVSKIYNEIAKDIPDFKDEINAFYEEIRNINVTASSATTKYLEKEIDSTFVGDLLDYYLLYSGSVYNEVPQPIEEARQKVDALMVKVQSLLPKIRDAFLKLQAALQARVEKLHKEVLYDIANRLYAGGKITHPDIFWFGSLNLNNTFKYWVPLITAENSSVDAVMRAIVAKNYASYNIKTELVNITQEVLRVLKEYEYLFGAEVVKKRSAVVVAQLVDKPAQDYLDLLNANIKNITGSYALKSTYTDRLPVLEADRIAFLKKGVQTFPGSVAPYVENSHYHSLKVYQTKLELNTILTDLQKTKFYMLASEAGILAAKPEFLERIRTIANEYIAILHKYADLKKKGQQFVADLPSIVVIAYRILRDKYGLEINDIPDFTEDIVRDDAYYASLNL